MSRRLFIFQKAPNFKPGNPVFTHYWENEGQNYFDSVKQSTDVFGHVVENETIDFVSSYEPLLSVGPTEAYLDQFRSRDEETGEETGYTWAELDSSRYQRETITTIKVEMTTEDFDNAPVLFFKLVDWDEDKGIRKGLPLYYYSTNVTQVSDQNYETTSYSVECTLDMWATIWVYMHSVMKGCSEELKWSRKMADRFIFSDQDNWDPINLIRKDGSEGYGFWIDYLDQPYLLRTEEWKSNLIVADERENALTLDDWLYINSSEKQKGVFKDTWLEDIWLPWMANQWCGVYFPKKGVTKVKDEEIISPDEKLENCYKRVNYYAYPISDNSFNDSLYNSNSKYRYLVCKTGNNTWPTSSDEGNKEKGVMFAEQKLVTYDIEPNNSTFTVPTLILDDSNWDKERNNLTFYKDIKISDTKFEELNEKFILSFENYILNKKYFKLQITYDDFKKSYIFTDGLDKQLQFILVDGKQKNKFYQLAKLPSKSFVYDIQGHSSSLVPSLGLVFTDDGIYMRFKCRLDLNVGDISYQDIMKINMNFAIVSGLHINIGRLFSDVIPTGDVNTQRKINGESLVLIPIKKGEDEQLYLQYLNNPDEGGITMGDGSVLGMVINDIPPSVLATALRTFADNTETQPFGDIVSCRNGEEVPTCPLSIMNLAIKSSDTEAEYLAPVLFSEFDYIPVCVATSPTKEGIYSVIGGNNFFNYLYDVLTNDSLTKENTKYVEPLLYGPAFWKWTYFIDGKNFIELTADKLDLKKMITEDDWNIYLNVNMSDTTHYFLDFTDLKNSKYPMTKIGMEFISSDSTNFPFTTEAYTHWLQNNQWSKEGSKNALDIKNKYAHTQAVVNAATAPFAGMAGGATAGLSGGLGVPGAIIGGIGGAVAGGIKSLTTMLGVNNAIKQANEEWNNQWKTDLTNMYSAPSYLVSSGFNTGSVIYSPSVESLQSSYELFRTYRLPDQFRDLVWHDIATNGYMYMSECPYYTYNNRVKFNIVNCAVDDKAYTITNYLRLKMFDISPLLSQQDSIGTFFDKCKNMFRVFKDVYDPDNLEELIKGNVEIQRLWYKPYYGSALFTKFELGASYFESQLAKDWVSWENNYSFDNTNNIYNTKNGLSGTVNIQIPYSKLGKYNTYSEICNDFEFLTVDNADSYCAAISENYTLYEKINNLEYSEQKGISFDEYTLNTPVEYYNIQDWGIFGWLLLAKKESDIALSKYYENGWKITLNADDNNKQLQLQFEPYSRFNFESLLYTLDNTWTVNNNWKEFSSDYTKNMFDIQRTWYDVLGKENAKYTYYGKRGQFGDNGNWYNRLHNTIKNWNFWGGTCGMCLFGFSDDIKYAATPHHPEGFIIGRDMLTSNIYYKTMERYFNNDYSSSSKGEKVILENIPEQLLSGENYMTVDYLDEVQFNFYSDSSASERIPSTTPLNDSHSQLNEKFTLLKINNEKMQIGEEFNNNIEKGFALFRPTPQKECKAIYFQSRNSLRLVKNSKGTYNLVSKISYASFATGQGDMDSPMLLRWVQIKNRSSESHCKITFHVNESENTAWVMNNQLNNLIFVSKNSTPEDNRIININLRNKKEG